MIDKQTELWFEEQLNPGAFIESQLKAMTPDALESLQRKWTMLISQPHELITSNTAAGSKGAILFWI
jgi:hypothetical protein